MPLQISFSSEHSLVSQSALLAGLDFGLCGVYELGKVNVQGSYINFIIQAEKITMKTTYMIFLGMNNLISEISALITQIEITAIAIRLYVTSSRYLRWR